MNTNSQGGIDTPAERAGIKVEGENKWLTLIQNAAHPQTVNRENEHPQ